MSAHIHVPDTTGAVEMLIWVRISHTDLTYAWFQRSKMPIFYPGDRLVVVESEWRIHGTGVGGFILNSISILQGNQPH